MPRTSRTRFLRHLGMVLSLSSVLMSGAEAASVHGRHSKNAATPHKDSAAVNAWIHPAYSAAVGQGAFVAPDGAKLVALSFDDGPDALYTPVVEKELREAGVHATFFLVGERAREDPARVRDLIADGDEIGPHGYRHVMMTHLSDEALANAMQESAGVLRDEVHDADVRWYRPPYGDTNARVAAAAAKVGLDVIRWDVDPSDWDVSRTPAQIEGNVLSHLHPGAVVLLHSIRKSTAEMLPDLLAKAKAQGYRFVTVTDWWKARGVPDERARCEPPACGVTQASAHGHR